MKKGNKKLTVDELRAYEGFENLTDKEAEETLSNIYQFAEIVVTHYLEQKEKGT